MRTRNSKTGIATMKTSIAIILAATACILAAPPARAQQAYATPEDAAKDLISSAKAGTAGFAVRIFGKDGLTLLQSGDPATDAQNLDEFNDAAARGFALDDGDGGSKLLEVGSNGWTFPLPLVKSDAGWRFDPVRGREEILDRRIGYDELSAIAACDAYVQAQDEYFRLDRDNNGLREYARKIISTPGAHDGLYWPAENQADISPLDGAIEDINFAERSRARPEPYNGYYFRILTAQGPAAPGGAHSYLINGFMIAGHALVAWPADWGDSGVQTFICGQNGSVYQKNLGANTAALARGMAAYNPDPTWTQVK